MRGSQLCSPSRSIGFMLGTHNGTSYENACHYMQLVALFYTFCFTGNTFAGYFNGIGHVSIPFIGAASHIALRVILSWLLIEKMGLPEMKERYCATVSLFSSSSSSSR